MWRGVASVVLACQVLVGCSLGASASTPASHVASPAKLRILRQSFADPRTYHRVSSIATISKRLPIVMVRPDAPLASDRSLDSVWITAAGTSRNQHVTVVWKSGVVETIDRWRCNCEAAANLREMGRHDPFRFLRLRGAPAITAPSDPRGPVGGLVSAAAQAYGVPASVETIRDGYNVTLYQYGAGVQSGLIAAAKTLPLSHTALRVYGYEAGGAPLGTWNGPKGIHVAPHEGATFGIGFALQNVTGKPLTITGVAAIKGFIRLIGVHLRPYARPSGGAAGGLIVRPYDATPDRLHSTVKPRTWVGVQLDFGVRNPCIHWASGIYDRTVEVAYTEPDGTGHIQEVPMVPLTIHRRHHHSC
jgi:hypothetical protein